MKKVLTVELNHTSFRLNTRALSSKNDHLVREVDQEVAYVTTQLVTHQGRPTSSHVKQSLGQQATESLRGYILSWCERSCSKALLVTLR